MTLISNHKILKQIRSLAWVILILVIASLIVSLTSCTVYDYSMEQEDCLTLKRAYKDYKQSYRQGCTDDTFIQWLNNDSGNSVYMEGGLFEENDTVIGTDTLYFWENIK
jgi:hypothetical protein